MKISKKIQEVLKGLVGSYKEQPPQKFPNKDFVSLCENLAELVQMYDRMAKQMPEGEAKDLAEDFSEQIITTLSLSKDCSPINSDLTFDSRRHTPVPFSLVEDETPIESVVRIGIAIDDVVIIPARVKIKE